MLKAKLTLSKIEKARRPGLLGDGAGLYLSVAPGGSKSWCFRFKLAGRQRTMGLGGIDKLNLHEARERANAGSWSTEESTRLTAAGASVPSRRRRRRSASGMLPSLILTRIRRAGPHPMPGNGATISRPTFFPKIAALPMQAANDTEIVLAVLEPIWQTRTETAWRIRGRLEMVIN